MKRRTLLAAGATALSPLAFARQSSSAMQLVAADVHPADYPTVAAVRWMAEQLHAETAGELAIKQYHSGQLGRESDTIDLVRLGALDMTRVFAGGLNNAVKETKLLSLPGLFRSVEHQRACLDGTFGQSILDSLSRYQLKGLAIYDAGARHFYAHRPILVPRDLRGLKIRVPVSDLFIELMTTLGANPTPLPYGAVYSALETGLIDGAENNLRSFHSSRHFESAKILSLSAHTYTPDILVLSMRRWNQLSADLQQRIARIARDSVKVMRALWDQGDLQAQQALKLAGVQWVNADQTAFAEAGAPLLTQVLADPTLRDLVRLVQRQ
jgi:tripartite ATP-independent transporter DctP family solute receptor